MFLRVPLLVESLETLAPRALVAGDGERLLGVVAQGQIGRAHV